MGNYRLTTTKKILAISFLYLLSFLYIFSGIQIIGFIGLLLILLAPIFATFARNSIHINTITFCWTLLIVYSMFLFTKGNVINGIYHCFVQILVISFVTCFQNYTIAKRDLQGFISFMHTISIVLVIYNIGLLFVSSHLGIVYSGYKYALRTILYGTLLIGLYRKEFTSKQLYLRIIVIGVLMFIFTERTMALGMLVLWTSYFIVNKFRRPSVAKCCFLVMLILILIIPTLYIGLYNSSFSRELNALVSSYTHKNLFSGRQELWAYAIDIIKEKWFSGYGYGKYLFEHGSREMSVHNTYLFLLLQGGVLNLSLIMAFFYSLFSKLVKNLDNYYNRLSASILLTMMFLASFGLILFVNNILYSMLLWTCVGFGLIRIKNDIHTIKG